MLKTVVVCDVCGAPAAESVEITRSKIRYRKDVCSDHGADLMKGAVLVKQTTRKRVTGTRTGTRVTKAERAKRDRAMRKAYASGMTAIAIAETYGVSRQRVQQIVRGARS
jgi:hypothetical protein